VLRTAVKRSVFWAIAWSIGLMVSRYLRHGKFLREDLVDVLIVGGFLVALGVVLDLYRAKRRISSEKSNAA
jgi:hypothetical protein